MDKHSSTAERLCVGCFAEWLGFLFDMQQKWNFLHHFWFLRSSLLELQIVFSIVLEHKLLCRICNDGCLLYTSDAADE